MKKYLMLFLLPALLTAQEKIVKDTSFTLSSSAQKTVKDYPDAKPVEFKLPANVKAVYNLVYSGKNLRLDLFLPKKAKKNGYPLVALIHGGGWRSGDKTMDHPLASVIASYGYAAAAVEYRLSTEALYPAAIYDVKNAVGWLKNNAAKYNINPDKIVLMGSSAGGQIAALAGATTGIEKFEKGVDKKNKGVKISAVIDLDGVFDMTTPAESGKDTIPSKPSAVKQWLGVKYADNPSLWIEASPLTYINKDTPPILFINSSWPRFHAGRDEAIEIMSKMNIYTEVHTIPGTPHPFWLFHPWFEKVIEYITPFLEKVLK